jgi:hypothetical protein
MWGQVLPSDVFTKSKKAGPDPTVCPHLWTVDTVESDTLGLTQVHDLDSVTIDDSNYLTGEVFSGRRETEQKDC